MPKSQVTVRLDKDRLARARKLLGAATVTEAIEQALALAAVDIDGGPFAKFGPDTFVVIEKWESMDDLKAHGASEHMKSYAAKNKDLLANRAVHVLQNA